MTWSDRGDDGAVRALRSAPVSILFLAPDLTILDATDRYLADTMRTRDEIVGLPLFVAFPENPDDELGDDGVSALRGSLDRVRSSRQPDTMPVQRYDIPRPDGTGFEERHWSPINTPVLDDDGEIVLIHHQVTDVTEWATTTSELQRTADERRSFQERSTSMEREIVERSLELHRTAAALRASEERFRMVCDATSDALWDWDVASDRLWWSDGIERLFGYRPAELSPTLDSWTTLIHPGDHDRVLASLHEAMDGGATEWELEYRFSHRDGRVVWVEDRCLFVRDHDGHAYRVVGGMADVTERRLVEQQFFRAQRMESVGMLAGGIAHDLNNVLAPILMAAEMLEIDEVDPDRRDVLQVIASSARRGASMLQQVLAFARGTDGQVTALSVASLVDDVVRFVREAFTADIAVAIDSPIDRDLTIVGDATKLHQVLLNLCVNARDAMPGGGSIGIRAVHDASTPGTVGADGRHVVISVSDTGSGMGPEVMERIFDPFFTTKAPGSGTGLGLSTSASIVRDHGGTIDVRSELGDGSTFTVRLPLAEARDVERPVRRELPRGGGQSVLVIDDEELVLAITGQTLEASGYRVRTTTSGIDAVALLAGDEADVDLVITDMVMPILDGPATIQALRRVRPDLVFVATSGLDAQETTHRAAEVGVHHVLAKPYTAADLLETIGAALAAS